MKQDSNPEARAKRALAAIEKLEDLSSHPKLQAAYDLLRTIDRQDELVQRSAVSARRSLEGDFETISEEISQIRFDVRHTQDLLKRRSQIGVAILALLLAGSIAAFSLATRGREDLETAPAVAAHDETEEKLTRRVEALERQVGEVRDVVRQDAASR